MPLVRDCSSPLLWVAAGSGMTGLRGLQMHLCLQLLLGHTDAALPLVVLGLGTTLGPPLLCRLVHEVTVVTAGLLLSACGCLLLCVPGVGYGLWWLGSLSTLLVAVGSCWLPVMLTLIASLYPGDQQGEVQVICRTSPLNNQSFQRVVPSCAVSLLLQGGVAQLQVLASGLGLLSMVVSSCLPFNMHLVMCVGAAPVT